MGGTKHKNQAERTTCILEHVKREQMLKRILIMGGTSTIPNPAEEQHIYCNMLRENKCERES